MKSPYFSKDPHRSRLFKRVEAVLGNLDDSAPPKTLCCGHCGHFHARLRKIYRFGISSSGACLVNAGAGPQAEGADPC